MNSSRNPPDMQSQPPQEPESNGFKTLKVVAATNLTLLPFLFFCKNSTRVAATAVANSALAYGLHEIGLKQRRAANWWLNIKSEIAYPITMNEKINNTLENISAGGAKIYDYEPPKNRS